MKRGAQQSEMEALEEELALVLSWSSLCPPNLSVPSFKAPPSLSAGSSVMSDALIQNTALCFQPDGPLREGGRRRSAVFSHPTAEQSPAVGFFPPCM